MREGKGLPNIFSPPYVENDTRKKLMGTIAFTLAMFGLQLTDEIKVENPFAPRRTSIFPKTQRGATPIAALLKILVEERTDPLPKRRIETALRGVASFWREKISEGVNENGLGAAVSNFIVKGCIQACCHEIRIQKRNTDFQPRGHAHAIRVFEDVIHEESLHVQLKQPIVRFGDAAFTKCSAQDIHGRSNIAAIRGT